MKRSAIRRKRPMARGSKGLARPAPMPKVNRRRRGSEFARCYGSRARVRFVAKLSCAACGDTDPRIPRENAHGWTGGAGRKGDADTILPLCHRCHHRQHQSGWLAIGMTEESRRRAAALTEALWLAHRTIEAPDAA